MTEMANTGVIADRVQRLQKAIMTTGDLGGAGQAPTSVSQGNSVCPECGREGGRHKKGCSCVGEKEVGLTKSTPADKTPKPFSSSRTSNWVAKAGGLPNYVQHVAHALVRKGKSESAAIRMAIGIMKNWAEGKGDVSPEVRAAAAKALAQWEKMKASTRVKKELADEVDSVSLDDPDIVWAMERAGLEICKEDIVSKAFDPHQPRDEDGQWVKVWPDELMSGDLVRGTIVNRGRSRYKDDVGQIHTGRVHSAVDAAQDPKGWRPVYMKEMNPNDRYVQLDPKKLERRKKRRKSR